MVNVRKNIIVNDYFSENDAAIWSFNRNLIHLKPLIDLDSLLLKLSKIPDITITLKGNISRYFVKETAYFNFIFFKEDMPERLHYRHNRRIGDVIISALEGAGFIYMSKEPIMLNLNGRLSNIMLSADHKRKFVIAAADKATHGYDKSYLSMKGIFLARGAMFKRNFSSESFIENVDIYPLLCNILAIECDKRNGTFDRVKRFLKYEHRMLAYESDKQKYELYSNKGGILFSNSFSLIIFGFNLIFFNNLIFIKYIYI